MTATSRCLETAPCRSLEEVRMDLRRERIALLSAQFDAETAGNHAAAADCLRRIAAVEERLMKLEAANPPR
jgi:hypothetical protein